MQINSPEATTSIIRINGVDEFLLDNINNTAANIKAHFNNNEPLTLCDQTMLARQALVLACDLLAGLPPLENGREYKDAYQFALKAEGLLDDLESAPLVRIVEA